MQFVSWGGQSTASKQVSISSTFYGRTSFRQLFLRNYVTRDKAAKQFSYEKFVRKMLMKLAAAGGKLIRIFDIKINYVSFA